MYRLSKTLTEVCGLKSHVSRSFFSGVHCYQC